MDTSPAINWTGSNAYEDNKKKGRNVKKLNRTRNGNRNKIDGYLTCYKSGQSGRDLMPMKITKRRNVRAEAEHVTETEIKLTDTSPAINRGSGRNLTPMKITKKKKRKRTETEHVTETE
ncbi:MAG TPA: hypothetical protein VFV08_05350, partial [Puia sp.]|nr:hypothetical protein [Puia sp.]